MRGRRLVRGGNKPLNGDGAGRGFRLPRGVTLTRDGTIQLAFTFGGRHYRERISLRPTKSNIEYADRKRQAVLYDIERGAFDLANHFPDSPRAKAPCGKTVPTVAAALDAYLRQQKRHLAPSTLRDYRSSINAHLLPAFGRLRLDELTVSEVRDWIARVPVSPQRIRKVLAPLRAVFLDALSDQLVDRNPLARVRLTSASRCVQAGPSPLTPEEVSRVLACSEPMYARYVACAVGTGLRTSELLGLQWCDVNLAEGYVEVRQALVNGILKRPKTAAGRRRVQLTALAWKALRAQRAIGGSVASAVWHDPATGKRLQSSQQIRRAWQRACQRAGVRYRRPYECRHTYASWMLTSGQDPSWIATQLGHRDCGMVRRTYARWMPMVRPEVSERATRLFNISVRQYAGAGASGHFHTAALRQHTAA